MGKEASLPDLQRRVYLDNLRVFLILMVFLVHCAMPFIAEDRWHISNDESSFAAAVSIGFCYQWVLQLFFLVSGASTGLSLRNRSAGQFVKERLLRLGIPYVAGLAVLVPFQLYFESLQRGKFSGSMLGFYQWFYSGLHIDWRLSINYETFHFWFLRFLLQYSLIALPLFLFLRSGAGQRTVTTVVKALEKWWGFFLFVAPVAAAQMVLHAKYPGHEGWSNYVCWLLFFVFGYFLTAGTRLEQAIAGRVVPVLVMGMSSFAAMGLLFFLGYVETWELSPSYSVGYVLYQGLVSFNTCCWVLFFLGMGMLKLEFRHRIWAAAAGLVLPFYILHHVTIITVAYYVVQMKATILTKYLLISIPSLILTVLLCEFVVRRLSLLRLFFGLRVRPKRASLKPVMPAMEVE